MQLDNNFALKHRIESEKKIFKNMSESYLLMKEIVHDIKSPIMSINFFLADPILYKEQIREVVNRVNSIINRISNDALNQKFGWYSVEFINSKIEEIVCTKMLMSKVNIQSELQWKNDIEVYIEPVDFLIVIDEIVVNAIKYGIDKINLKTYLNDSFVVIVDNHYNSNCRQDPWSYGSGISNIKKKILSMDGKILFSENGGKFECKIGLMYRKL